ncbi:Uncharacterised protein [uncultured archaeon]|nr:Uncharacterised protein [uncultured archaeon]
MVRVKTPDGRVPLETRTAYLSGLSRNISNQYTVLNPTNRTTYRIGLYAELPKSTFSNSSQITVSGGEGIYLKSEKMQDTYLMEWQIPQLAPGEKAISTFNMTNVSTMKNLLNLTTSLTSSFDNVSALTLLNVTLPVVQTNSSAGKIIVYTAYSGDRPANVTYFMSLVAPSMDRMPPLIFNPYQYVMEQNNTIQMQTFFVQSTKVPGVYHYRLALLGPFIAQTYLIYLNITGVPPVMSASEQNILVGSLVAVVVITTIVVGVLISPLRKRTGAHSFKPQ